MDTKKDLLRRARDLIADLCEELGLSEEREEVKQRRASHSMVMFPGEGKRERKES